MPMPNRKINIIALNVPWPANYGGVIDIFYMMKALHDCGVKIVLHCFEYGRQPARELEELCLEVHYYPRQTGLLVNLTYLPYNVFSRKSSDLIENLTKNDYPILFFGLHSCYYFNDPRIKNRFKIVRACNVEHHYYRELARVEANPVKKGFFLIESLRFKWFLGKTAKSDLLIAVSDEDANYFKKRFPEGRIECLPCFHGNEKIISQTGKSDKILFHGNLSVKENEAAAIFLIQHVFANLPSWECVIAGMQPSPAIYNAANAHPHIVIEANPSASRMASLISSAHVNLLITFQGTGLKLKLLNSLFAGRHVVANSVMLRGSGLDSLCHLADSPSEMVDMCAKMMQIPFSESDIKMRRSLLFPKYSDQSGAEKLASLVFGND